MTTYNEAVAEFRRLDGEIEADQWEQARLTWENAAPDGTRDGRKSLRAWSEDVHQSGHHIGVLWRMWNDLVRSASQDHLPPWNETYQRTDSGADWQEINNQKRATSALGKLPPERQAKIVREALADPKVAEQTFTDPEITRQAFANPSTRAHAIKAIHKAQDDAETELAETRQRRVDDGQRPDFDRTAAVHRVGLALDEIVLAAAKMPGDLSSRERETIAYKAERAKPTVDYLTTIETNVDEAEWAKFTGQEES